MIKITANTEQARFEVWLSCVLHKCKYCVHILFLVYKCSNNSISGVQLQKQKTAIEGIVDHVLRQCSGCVIPQSFLVTTTSQVNSFTDHKAIESGQIATPCHVCCQPAVPPDSTLSSSLSSTRQSGSHHGYQLLFAQGDREHGFPCKLVTARVCCA